jgi:DUF4097 and DUF4098 domain-containing protein YvlB
MVCSSLVRTAAVLSIAASSIFASEIGTFHRTLTVSGPVTLDVVSAPGGIAITSGPSDSVVVHAVIKPLFGQLDLDLAQANIRALEQYPPIEQTGNRIRIGYTKNPALLRGVSISFEIETPHASEVHAKTQSGGININGVSGPVEAQTSSGKTEMTNLAGDVKVTGHSGAISIRGVDGRVTAHCTSGGIQLTGIASGVDAETTSGRLELADIHGDVHTTTHSGSILIDNVKGSVVAHNSSGSIDALQLGGSIHAETGSGAIRISQIVAAPIRALAHSGAIKVELAKTGSYALDAQSNSGKVAGPVTNTLNRIAEAHSLKAQIGLGGPLVDLDTDSSKIEVRQ